MDSWVCVCVEGRWVRGLGRRTVDDGRRGLGGRAALVSDVEGEGLVAGEERNEESDE